MIQPTSPSAQPARANRPLSPPPNDSEGIARHSIKPAWTLLLTKDAIYFLGEKESSGTLVREKEAFGFSLSREELVQSAVIRAVAGEHVVLAVMLDAKRSLVLPKAAASDVENWLGDRLGDLVRRSVRELWRWKLILGLFLVLGSMLTERTAEDTAWLIIGLGFAASGLAARLRPAPWIWLQDALIHGAWSVVIVVGTIQRGSAYYMLAFAALILWNATGDLRRFRRYHARSREAGGENG